MSTPQPEDQADALKDAIFNGRKIAAIKLYREQTKVGLAEAKKAVEKMEADLRLSSPERFTSQAQGKGCFALVLAFALIGGVLWKWLA